MHQLVKGGWHEIVISPSDHYGTAQWFQWDGRNWKSNNLSYVVHGHTLDLADFDNGGNLDIMIGEMGDPGDGANSEIWIWYGDGKGHFKKVLLEQAGK